MVPNEGDYVSVQKMEFDWLVAAIRVALHHRLHGIWNKGNTQKYLHYCGLNEEFCKILESTVSSKQDYATEEDLQREVIPPAYIRSIRLCHYTDAGMHLLKGIADSVIGYVASWFKLLRKNVGYCRKASIMLRSTNNLQLSWLCTIPFGGKENATTGGWVSENYIDYIRVAPYLLSVYIVWCVVDAYFSHDVNST